MESAVVEEQSDDEVVGESGDEDMLEDARSYLITLQITRELDMGDYTQAYWELFFLDFESGRFCPNNPPYSGYKAWNCEVLG